MKLTAICHCGAVRITVPRRPPSLTDCNCSICRRYGVLWAYYQASSVRIEARSATKGYSWGRKKLRFVWCNTCGCLMYWQRVKPDPDRQIGVNARNFEPSILGTVRVSPLDAASWPVPRSLLPKYVSKLR